jgi:hypothetical protein
MFGLWIHRLNCSYISWRLCHWRIEVDHEVDLCGELFTDGGESFSSLRSRFQAAKKK